MRLVSKLVAVATVLAPAASFAAMDPLVGTALTSAGADGLLYVGALAVAAAGFILIKKVLGKIGLTF